jgi:hypothetical protein
MSYDKRLDNLRRRIRQTMVTVAEFPICELSALLAVIGHGQYNSFHGTLPPDIFDIETVEKRLDKIENKVTS